LRKYGTILGFIKTESSASIEIQGDKIPSYLLNKEIIRLEIGAG